MTKPQPTARTITQKSHHLAWQARHLYRIPLIASLLSCLLTLGLYEPFIKPWIASFDSQPLHGTTQFIELLIVLSLYLLLISQIFYWMVCCYTRSAEQLLNQVTPSAYESIKPPWPLLFQLLWWHSLWPFFRLCRFIAHLISPSRKHLVNLQGSSSPRVNHWLFYVLMVQKNVSPWQANVMANQIIRAHWGKHLKTNIGHIPFELGLKSIVFSPLIALIWINSAQYQAMCIIMFLVLFHCVEYFIQCIRCFTACILMRYIEKRALPAGVTRDDCARAFVSINPER